MKVRTRIAPSPTGMLHIGTARTALFNYLFAKKHGGQFLLRIEDTDTARNTKESYDAIFQGLNWLGLHHDETVEYQSKRGEFYKLKLAELVKKGIAYYSYISNEEIERRKAEAEKNGHRYLHRYSDEDAIVVEGVKPVVRLKVQSGVHIVIEDLVQGRVVINTDTIEDFVLARSDDSPVYMFAVVCDDIDMQMSHVIRGVDHLTNTAKQILLFEALGVQLPVFAHIPLIHGEDGAKLSKRHGAVGTLEYKEQGYLPEAIRSYLLRLGWSNGMDDILTDEQAVQVFNLEGVGRSPARFDIAKLKSINEFFIKNAENSMLLDVIAKDYSFNISEIMNINEALTVAKSRSKTLLELMENLHLFKKDFSCNESVKLDIASKVKEFISDASPSQDLHKAFKVFLEKNGLKFKDVGPAFRLMLIGTASSIGVFDIIAVLGLDETKKRVLSFKNII